MPARCEIVICEDQGRAELPEWAREGALLQRRLVETGRWEEASEWLRVYRHVGYTAMDVGTFLVLYFASGLRESLKEFGVRTSPYRAQLAALAQRRQLATPSSVSRLLGRATEADVRPVGSRLLLDVTDAGHLLQHPAAAVYDTFGKPWHWFDSDGTNQTFRERALPAGPDLPVARRRCRPELARRGYVGRKRGELRCCRGTLQHAGTGLWVALALSPERADNATMLPWLLDGLEHACRVGGLPRERAILRADGAGGNVPWLTVCQQRGIHYLTRWGHYSLLRQPDVQAQLTRGPWYEVASAGAGPRRAALELGEVELRAAPHTLDATGAAYAPVRSRIVVSRFRADSTSSVGMLIDGWVYELFATDLPADAWPCAEVVTQYFGRAAEENRFAQEDREIGLDHLFSYSLPGQELACLFGLMVWNLRLTFGFAQHKPPTELPAPTPRAAIKVVSDESPAMISTADAPPTVASLTAEVSSAVPSIEEMPAEPTASAPATKVESALFNELPWQQVLERMGPEWARTPAGDGLTCPNGSELFASAVIASRYRGGAPALRLLASVSACRPCPRRTTCTQAHSPHFVKSVHVPLTTAQGEQLVPLLSDKKRRGSLEQYPPPSSPTPKLEPPRRPLVVHPSDPIKIPGPYAPSEARLMPSEFRHAFRSACREIAVTVSIPPRPANQPRRPLGISYTAAECQRRRRAWRDRFLDNSLPLDAGVRVRFSASRHVLEAVGMRPDGLPAG